MHSDERTPSYRAAAALFTFCLNIFYSEVRARGAYKIPSTGPVIFVCAPHANQFVDPVVLISHAKRQVGFLAAKKSMDKFWIGLFARSMDSIPVVRPQDLAKAGTGTIYISLDSQTTVHGIGTRFIKEVSPRSTITVSGESLQVIDIVSDTVVIVKSGPMDPRVLAALTTPDTPGMAFKITPHVDQSSMFDSVIARLHAGGCIGIFPEGGSHDRSDLLPLKPGVAMMALGAMAEHADLNVKIVPCGLNYFHADKFRSRVVIEFGDPMDVPADLVAMYKAGGPGKRIATGKLLDQILLGIKAVTVRAPDYDTLMVIQAVRRLYQPVQTELSIEQNLILTRRFAEAFEKLKSEPQIQEIVSRVKEYNKLLMSFGIRDHQVINTNYGGVHALKKLLYRFIQVIVLFTLAAPGALLHAPIVIICSQVGKAKQAEALRSSTVKIEGKDVVATWKMLAALVVAPLSYLFYTLIFWGYMYFFTSASPSLRALLTVLSLLVNPIIGYSAMRTSEIGMDVLKTLKPLLLSVFHPRSAGPLRALRADLTHRINEAINMFGPRMYGDGFSAMRIVSPNEASYGEYVSENLGARGEAKAGSGGGLDGVSFRWEEVDSIEAALADDVFLFSNPRTGEVKGHH